MSAVYFIYDGEYTKIGITAGDVKTRMSALQSPRELACLGTVPGGRELEAKLHELFAERRVRGEWFIGRITAKDAKHALERDEARHRAAMQRLSERQQVILTWGTRSKLLSDWLAEHTGVRQWVDSETDWTAPWVQMHLVPILEFFDSCVEAGADPRDALEASR